MLIYHPVRATVGSGGGVWWGRDTQGSGPVDDADADDDRICDAEQTI